MISNIGKIQKLVSPNPFALASTRKSDGSTNLMALSWWTFVSNHPAMLAISLSNKGLSGKLIAKNHEFGLNIVDEALKDQAFLCGTCSGANEDKVKKFGIELINPTVINTKLVKEHKVSLECRVTESMIVSDHTIYIAEVLAARCNPEKRHLYAVNGYSGLDTVE